MYPGMATIRRQSQEEDRQRHFSAYSPTQGHPYSPTSRHEPSSPQSLRQSGIPPAAAMALPPHISPRLGTSPSPKMNGGNQPLPQYNATPPSTSTRYDPLADHRDPMGTKTKPMSQNQSPLQTRGSLPPYTTHQPDPTPSPNKYHSPTHTKFPHHQSPSLPSHAHLAKAFPESPTSREHDHKSSQGVNGLAEMPSSQGTIDEDTYNTSSAAGPTDPAPKKPDPMSFSNILSSDTAEPPRPATRGNSIMKSAKVASPTINGDGKTPTSSRKASTKATSSPRPVSDASKNKSEFVTPAPPRLPSAAKRKQASIAKDNERVLKEMARIESLDLSDIETSEFEDARQDYLRMLKKRQLAIEALEQGKRKRRRTASARKLSMTFGVHADDGKQRFWALHAPAAMDLVQHKQTVEDKERKKDQQRKRRRERALAQQSQTRQRATEMADAAEDDTERRKYLREAQRADKRFRNTQKILTGRSPSPVEGLRDLTPMATDPEAAAAGTLPNGVSPEPPRKKARVAGSSRPKKSKEKKEAEKAAAEAGFAAGLHTISSAEPVAIAPKEDYEYIRETRQSKAQLAKDGSPAAHVVTNYSSKGYHQIYEQIWKDIARKEIPKVYRIKENSLATKQSNLRKTVQLASKEAKRWQLRTNKGTKDVQARAKRSMREMMSFWKRNERAERDLRKNAEKQELENARKAEADRESNRQKRKLNFLIEQTELYAHFIERKIKTDEVEKSTDPDVGVSTETVQPGKPDAHTVNLPTSKGSKVTGFDKLDFDAEDESSLREAAMANAQNAVEEAQAKAKAFNSGGQDLQSQFDDGEMNFQNPTGLGDINIGQPKMLSAQLKEYQLKGLNWLVNLYEQGINGILADEMGLGKTVQSISVMGYLAEKYNIWGPFLVIAPSSTLHNWQQEIARFLPGLKCLPYWGNAKDRKILRKFWDRKSITYNQDSPFHVLITSYQLVVLDTPYFQKMRWQYMVLDEAQAIKSSQSSRWKSLLNFHCRNRLLLTGTPIQNNMQELWALLHFIMPSLFDSHDEFSDWFSKDIESHAQSNTKLNEDQLKRLHMILKPFMLRRVKKNVQKELGDKEEKDVYCDLTYRQRAYYTNLRNKISVMDLIEKAAVGDDQDTATLMNLVMQFRKVCNHPNLFERADTTSPLSVVHYAETASFLREGSFVNVGYSTRNAIEYDLPRLLCSPAGRSDIPGPSNPSVGTKGRYLNQLMNIWTPENISKSTSGNAAFAWLRFADTSVGDVHKVSRNGLAERALSLTKARRQFNRRFVVYEDEPEVNSIPGHALFNIVDQNDRQPLREITAEGRMKALYSVSRDCFDEEGLGTIEKCARPAATSPPIQICCSNQDSRIEREDTLFNTSLRSTLFGSSEKDEAALLASSLEPQSFPVRGLLPEPLSQKARFTHIEVPSMRRFVTDSGKLAKLDELLRELKEGGHRVLLYFQMTRMIDLMEEYLTFRNYKYLRLDGSTKLEDRRDTVSDFQTKPENFIFLLSTRAGGLGINLTAADTVIFYDSDWNPTIDSQAMDRAHRLGQTRQVTVYRLITRGTIEERIRKRALQKEEVQRVVISGQSGTGVDFNARSKENRTKDIALWLADDEQAELIEKKEAEVAAKGEEKRGRKKAGGRKKEVSLDEMYHEGEGHFDDGSNKPSGAATPIDGPEPAPTARKKGISKKAKTIKQRLAVADGSAA